MTYSDWREELSEGKRRIFFQAMQKLGQIGKKVAKKTGEKLTRDSGSLGATKASGRVKLGDVVVRPKKPIKPTPKTGETWDTGMTRDGKAVPSRNLSARYKTYKRKKDQYDRDIKDFNDKLLKDREVASNISNIGDNPEARAQIRDTLSKQTGDQAKKVKKINYNNYSDALKKWEKSGKKGTKPSLQDFLEQVMAAPTNNVGDGKIAGTVEAGDNPPVKKKKRYIYGGTGSRKRWMV